MAGHSHWSKIKRAKGATDAKRGKVWSKISRKIIIAAKNGGDPRDNLNLRYTIVQREDSRVLIPNANLLTNPIVVWNQARAPAEPASALSSSAAPLSAKAPEAPSGKI